MPEQVVMLMEDGGCSHCDPAEALGSRKHQGVGWPWRAQPGGRP